MNILFYYGKSKETFECIKGTILKKLKNIDASAVRDKYKLAQDLPQLCTYIHKVSLDCS
jgi:hypothetical protein